MSRVKVTRLANGLRVAVDEMPEVESASLGIWVACGTRHESAELNGMAHMLEHMAFKGTRTRSARAIAEEIENVGGSLNAYTGREITAYHASVLKEDTGAASGGVRKARLAGGLVVAQISLSLLLLICSGLLIRSFLKAQGLNPGFNGHNVLIMSYGTFTVGFSDSTGVEFSRQLIEELRTTPGVESVAVTNRVPLGFGESTSVKPEGYVPRANESMETDDAVVSPNYFRTMEIPLVKGRDFTSEDTIKTQHVVIVSEAFVNRYWPNQQAIGKKLFSDLPKEWLTVVGVARDIKVNGLNESPTPFVYIPLYQFYDSDLTVAVRTSGDPLAYRKAIEEKIHWLNSDLNVSDVTTLEFREQIGSIGQRIAGTFVVIFGLLALVLATVGIYGVTAYTTRQRTHEIDVRMALALPGRMCCASC